MKKHTFPRFLTLLFVLMTLSVCASAIEIKLYDNGELSQTLTSATDTLPEEQVRDGKALYGWTNRANGTHYGWKMLPTPTESMELDALWAPMERVKPGENAYKNGDFEGDGIYMRPSNGGTRIIAEADGNHVLEYTRGSGYASIQVFVGWQAGRKYHIHYRVKTPAEVSSHYNPIYGNADHFVGTATKAGEWVTVDQDFTLPSDASETIGTFNGFLSLYCNPMDGKNEGGTVYYDDLSLIPYAMVRYHAGGGSGAPEDTSLLSGTVEIPDVTPVRRGFIFAGWSLTEGGTTAVTSVEVNGADIDLYAIWNPVEDQDIVTYEYSNDRTGIADGTLSIIAPEEAAAYTGVSVYFANADGVMSGYTPFASMELTEGSASYTASGNRIFAPGATRLSIHFTASGKDDVVYWYDIPERHQNKAETPLFSFYAVSDIHLQDYWPEMATNRTRMVNDVIANNPAFTVIAGDLVNHGTTEQFARLDSFMKNNFNDAGRPAFIINGNHEFHINDKNSTEYDRDALLNSLASQIAANRAMGYEIRRDGDDLWYSAVIEGRKFIFMSTPSTPAKEELASYIVSDKQLAFLDEELAAAEKLGIPAFVISHVHLNGYVINGGSGITNTAAVEEILNRYPGTTMITAHTHSNLSLDRRYVLASDIGGMVFTHLNDGCSVWLEEGTSNYGKYEVAFSAGQVIDVYADKLIVKARKFADPCVYFGHGLYEIKLPGNNNMPKISITGGAPADGANLGVVDENGETLPSAYTFEWLVDGKVVSNNQAYLIQADSSMAGKYVVVRVSDGEGNYTYARTEQPFTAVTIHYDANGGTGDVPSDERVFAGSIITPDAYGRSPRKAGEYFIGWSTDKTAVQPDSSIQANADVTLYAVYSARPFFDFAAGLCGWSPKSTIKEYKVEDSILSYTDTGTDMYFTLSNISLPADEYRYMRIKRRYIEGSGDGMFFGVNGGGLSQDQRVPFIPETGTVVAEIDGMQVVEYDLQTIVGNYWKGTITTLRYDALASAGKGETDYILFSNKRGIYSAKIKVTLPVIGEEAPEGGFMKADDSTPYFTVENAQWERADPETGYFMFRANIVPKDGYEFAGAADIESILSLSCGRLEYAELNSNGSVTLYGFLDACVGTPADGQTQAALLELGDLRGGVVVLAYYNADGRTAKVRVLRDLSVQTGRLWVADMGDAVNVKAFVLRSESSLAPQGEAVSGVMTDLP